MTQYDPKFYDAIREGCQRSAEAVVPHVIDALPPIETVVDIGGGEGWWAQAFVDCGVTYASCLDGGQRPTSAPDVDHGTIDLGNPPPSVGTYDLAVCLEVAEHLPESKADGLVTLLANSANAVLFSAAMPRQGGTGHVNCQPPAYWAEKFAKYGFVGDGSIRWAIWDDPEVCPWYQSNVILFRHLGRPPEPHEVPIHVIHPSLWLSPR